MEENTTHSKNNPYPKFALIMAISFVVMYLVILNVADFSHVYTSLTRFLYDNFNDCRYGNYHVTLMWKMYPNLKVNLFILLFAATTHLEAHFSC
jgi:hypothetical protein